MRTHSPADWLLKSWRLKSRFLKSRYAKALWLLSGGLTLAGALLYITLDHDTLGVEFTLGWNIGYVTGIILGIGFTLLQAHTWKRNAEEAGFRKGVALNQKLTGTAAPTGYGFEPPVINPPAGVQLTGAVSRRSLDRLMQAGLSAADAARVVARVGTQAQLQGATMVDIFCPNLPKKTLLYKNGQRDPPDQLDSEITVVTNLPLPVTGSQILVPQG